MRSLLDPADPEVLMTVNVDATEIHIVDMPSTGKPEITIWRRRQAAAPERATIGGA